MPGILPIQAVKPILLAPKNQIPGAFTICTGMFGNGVLIGMIKTTIKTLFIKTRRALKKEATALSGAARGTTMPCSAGPRIGSGTCLTTGGSTSGFAARGVVFNNLLRIWKFGISL